MIFHLIYFGLTDAQIQIRGHFNEDQDFGVYFEEELIRRRRTPSGAVNSDEIGGH